jgi:hypothetical protein
MSSLALPQLGDTAADDCKRHGDYRDRGQTGNSQGFRSDGLDWFSVGLGVTEVGRKHTAAGKANDHQDQDAENDLRNC